MNIAVDAGNTMVKAAVFDNGQVLDIFKSSDEGFIKGIFDTYPGITSSILVSTRADHSGIERTLRENTAKYIYFDASVPVPLTNLYGTPDTLGCDRLAAAVGATAIYPGCNILVTDFGTAITIDMVTAAGEYIGGNISPGASARFRSLHEYTGKLPLMELSEEVALTGNNTVEAITGGVVNGIVFEIEGYISRMQDKYGDIRIIFTGGDSDFFVKRLKNPIFATYDLVVYGLNRILEYNAD